MNVQQISLTQNNWRDGLSSLNIDANIFSLFVLPEFNDKKKFLETLHNQYPNATLIGCSTAGEIVPFGKFSPCELHNQTMAITTLSEC